MLSTIVLLLLVSALLTITAAAIWWPNPAEPRPRRQRGR